MSDFHGSALDRGDGERFTPVQTFVAVALIAGFVALFAFAPPRDRSKPIAGIPCSVLSENEISAALGAAVQLTPTNGAICQYVSTASGVRRTLFVVAMREPHPVESETAGTSVYARSGARTYALTVVTAADDKQSARTAELRVAKADRTSARGTKPLTPHASLPNENAPAAASCGGRGGVRFRRGVG
jgi:hypothetical protein